MSLKEHQQMKRNKLGFYSAEVISAIVLLNTIFIVMFSPSVGTIFRAVICGLILIFNYKALKKSTKKL